jgi:hypothetical protein
MRDVWEFAAIADGAMVQTVRSALILLGTGFALGVCAAVAVWVNL